MPWLHCHASASVEDEALRARSSVFSRSIVSNPCRYLYTNQLTGPIPDSIGHLRDLQLLYGENGLLVFSSLVSCVYSHISFVSRRDLQNNTLNGTVPSWICKIFSYNLSNNTFACPLPSCCSSSGNGNGFCEPCFNATYTTALVVR
jgi:hypothetical protein